MTEWMICYRPITVIIIWTMTSLLCLVNAHGGCSVLPREIVTTVGGNVTLSCKTFGEAVINSWKQKNNGNSFELYKAPMTQRNKTIPEKIAPGYFFAWKGESEVTLYFNETNFSHAGSYVCGCSDWSSSANVAVIDSMPEVENDDNFTCSIKFNGSVRASFKLEIKDCSDSILVSSSNLPLSSHQTSYAVSTVKNNINETLVCSVKLTNDSSKDVPLYSKDVKHSSLCNHIPDSENSAQNEINGTPFIGLIIGLVVGGLLLAALVTAAIIFYRKRAWSIHHIDCTSQETTYHEDRTRR